MNWIEIFIILGLFLWGLLAIRSLRNKGCHDCLHCHKKCGGKFDGRKFGKVIKNQGK